MLPLPDFDLHRPQTLPEALRLRAALPKARILAGGTDLIPSMKQGLFTPQDVPVSYTHLTLPTICSV